MITRRRILVAGLLGGGALLAARWLAGPSLPERTKPRIAGSALRHLRPAAVPILAAIWPVLLEGALPAGAKPGEYDDEMLAGIDTLIAGLPPSLQAELDELFSLLAFVPARGLLAGVRNDWPMATAEELRGFLERWRASSWSLLLGAYLGLRQIVYGAWYANPRAWPAIGYDGPPLFLSERP